ncbi:hypothetical protein [Actinoallomurus iriomotensis]|uniref:Uncharacterized protein n=1 Tax=Actinoallomurus iriomotensis TaxID=478107 RepID=A0A9W6S3E8_9ACTN|nr:hypothetical protein [Actinoallomurus iriomotensis]GLY86443.1 hypothetical protein Airi02_043720 [Actinoallomurus iriomotensis]
MKVTSGTLLATAVLATTGGTFGPARFGGAAAVAAPAVHLVTSIQTLSRAPEGTRYAVSVRPVGGTARAATLVLSTFGPAAWTAAAPGCLFSADRTAMACDLGDLSPQRGRTLHVTARPGPGGPAQVPVVAQAGAANAPSVIASLGVAHPAAFRMVRRVRAPDPSSSPGTDASPEPWTSPAPAASPALEASPEPSPSFSTAPVSPEAAPWSAAAVPSRRARPARPAAKPPHRPATPATHSPAPSQAPSQAGPAPMAGAPAIPQVSVSPETSASSAANPPLGGPPLGGPPLGGPALPLPTISATPSTPRIAPGNPHEGVSQLDTLSPAGAMQAGRTSWATLIAIAVVTEAGLLWLVAGLTVMRRRRALGASSRRSGRRALRPLLSRIRP